MPLDPLTIVFALAALVTLWKLWSVLGTRNGLERRPRNPFVNPPAPERRASGAPTPAVRLPGAAPVLGPADPARWTDYVEPGLSLDGLEAISAADPNFAASPFLGGAKSAYEAILAAFAAGDRKTLQGLLAPDVYAGFDAALREREASGARHTTTIVSMDDARIHAAALEARMARVTVRFESKQITATHAADDSVIDGSADQIVDIHDLWTFARDVKSRDPNWKLTGTEAAP